MRKSFTWFLYCFVFVNAALLGSLTVTSITPSSGIITQGESVTIKGTGFSQVKDVYFGSVSSKNFKILSDDTLVAVAPIPPGPSGLVHVNVSNGQESSPFTPQNQYLFTQGAWIAYLSISSLSEGSILPFSLSPEQSSPPSITLKESSSYSLAISPNNTRLYAIGSNGVSGHNVVVIDIAKNQLIKEIPYPEIPTDIAISPTGQTGYVIYGNVLSEINLQNDSIELEIFLPADATQVAITPDSKKGYITHNKNNQITVVDLVKNKILKSIVVQKPYALGVNPNGKAVYVTTDENTGYVIDPTSDTIVAHFQVGQQPQALAVNPNANELYVTNFGDDTLSVVQLKDPNYTQTTIPVGKGPKAIAVAPDGKMAYVVNATDRTVLPIHLATHTALHPKPVNNSVSNIVITPDQSPVASFSAAFAEFLSFNFDASASKSPVGAIAEYLWVFEPPSAPNPTATTTNPLITHQFGTPGEYPVTLTAVNSAGTSIDQIFTGKTMSRNGSPLATTVGTVSVPWPPNF
jgi:DNA-binding beta-propeller fold protein YncE